MTEQWYKSAFEKVGKNDTQEVYTPPSLCREMISKIPSPKGDILVLYNIEFAMILAKEFGISPSSIYVYTNSQDKTNACNIMGFNPIYSEEILGIKILMEILILYIL